MVAARRFALSCLLGLTAAGGVAAGQDATGDPPDAARRFERRVVAIAAAETPADRVDAVEDELRALQLKPTRRTFTSPKREGTNLLAVVPPPVGSEPTRTLTLGAHLDRVTAGRGAVDNAGGCAAVLELLARFQARPLQRHRVVGLLFDLEEEGLLGSRAFAEAAGDPAEPGAAAGLPDLFVNVDVFAYGDTLWVHHPDESDRAAAATFVAGTAGDEPDAEPFSAVVGSRYPPSDHRSFAALRTNAEPGSRAAKMTVLSLSLLPKEQILETVEFLKLLEGGGRPARANLPRVLALIHTANDTPAAVRPADAAAGIDAVEAGLRALDAAAEKPVAHGLKPSTAPAN